MYCGATSHVNVIPGKGGHNTGGNSGVALHAAGVLMYKIGTSLFVFTKFS